MAEIEIRTDGPLGRITLNRPKALNALSYEMCLAIEAALDRWRQDPAVTLVLIDAAGEKAFCAGGDIQEMYDTGRAGDYGYGRKFWRDEYRMNAKLYEYPKPVISLMQGFVMGGGVGVGCHGKHRVVGASARISMPEVAIGLVPDVGGSFMLARAPGRLGEYLGSTGARMGPGDALLAGFADFYIPETRWPALIAALRDSGDAAALEPFTERAPEADMASELAQINRFFELPDAAAIDLALAEDPGDFAAQTRKILGRNAPLSVACAIEMVRRLRDGQSSMRDALELEYRFTHRAMEHADFIEGIRAAIIDKDRSPNWRHAGLQAVTTADVAHMLAPLGAEALTFEEEAA